jgi:hypothetical protein
MLLLGLVSASTFFTHTSYILLNLLFNVIIFYLYSYAKETGLYPAASRKQTRRDRSVFEIPISVSFQLDGKSNKVRLGK